MHIGETVSIAIPSGFHRPLFEPCVKFSLTRLSENSPPVNFRSFTGRVTAKLLGEYNRR